MKQNKNKQFQSQTFNFGFPQTQRSTCMEAHLNTVITRTRSTLLTPISAEKATDDALALRSAGQVIKTIWHVTPYCWDNYSRYINV